MTPLSIDWPRALARACTEPDVVRPVFQPIVDLKRGQVSGYEMLARFSGPPMAPPEAWFAAATEHGVAGALEAMMVRAGLAARPLLPPNTFLAINVSPTALDTPEIRRALSEPSSLDRIVIELTEQSQFHDYERLTFALSQLRARGAKIAVDDVGSAYAGLSQVMDVRPEFVKLDRRFISDIDRDPAKAAVVETVGEFASRLDAWVVAEGVERQEELDALVRLRVPLCQGFLVARPQAGMGDIDPEVGTRLRAHSFARLSRPSVGTLVEPTPAVRDHDGRDAVARLFSSSAPLEYLAVVDRRQRPVAVIARDAFLRHEQSRHVPLRVERGSRVSEVARRAMTRPAGERFDPVVCCDEAGRYIGLVRVERLVEALAD